VRRRQDRLLERRRRHHVGSVIEQGLVQVGKMLAGAAGLQMLTHGGGQICALV
jgi:hypothetical protein